MDEDGDANIKIFDFEVVDEGRDDSSLMRIHQDEFTV